MAPFYEDIINIRQVISSSSHTNIVQEIISSLRLFRGFLILAWV